MPFNHMFLQGHPYLIYKIMDKLLIPNAFPDPGYCYKRGTRYVFIVPQQDFENGQTETQRTIADVYLKSRNEWRKTYQLALELNQKLCC